MGLIVSTPSMSLVEVDKGTKILSPNIIITSLDRLLINWARKSSLWPVTFGLA